MTMRAKLRQEAARLHALWARFKTDMEGATAVEYGLLAGLIAVGLGGGIGALADLVLLLFDILVERTDEVGATIPATEGG